MVLAWFDLPKCVLITARSLLTRVHCIVKHKIVAGRFLWVKVNGSTCALHSCITLVLREYVHCSSYVCNVRSCGWTAYSVCCGLNKGRFDHNTLFWLKTCPYGTVLNITCITPTWDVSLLGHDRTRPFHERCLAEPHRKYARC